MKRLSILGVFVFGFCSIAFAQPVTFNAVLTASQETPPTNSSGHGTMTATLDASHTSLAVNLVFSGLTGPATAAHIHGEAPPGVATGVVISFNVPTNLSPSGNAVNTTFTIDKATGDKLVANPGLYYVNVHTAQNPGGEIRGQLAATGSTIYWAGDLRGSRETPPNNSTAVGAFFISLDANNNLTYEINTGGLPNPTLSHIHGPGGTAGTSVGVLITFASSASAFQNGRLSGVIPGSAISALDPTKLALLRSDPSQFYVNVHSTLDPGGEIRGQLQPASENDVAVAGKVTNGLGQNFVTDLRVFNPSFDTPVGALVEFFPAGATNTSAAASTVVNIPARGTAVMNDVNGASGLNTSGTGGLRVSSSSNLVVTSRIYNDQTAAGKGTFGQFVPGSPRSALLLHGVLPQLSTHSDLSAGSRTNVGFFNPNADTATVRLEVRDETGTSLATAVLALAGLSQQQASIGSYFPGVDLTNRPNLTLTFDSNFPIAAYGSVVDNVSSDQIFVVAQPDTGTPKS